MPPVPDWRLPRKMSRNPMLSSTRREFRGRASGLAEAFSLVIHKEENEINRNTAKATSSQAFFPQALLGKFYPTRSEN
jgi:hypothetical protein